MTEGIEHHAHHPRESKSDFSAYVLPLSILLASIILSYSMITSVAALNNGLTTFGVSLVNNGSLGQQGNLGNLPGTDPSQGELAPPAIPTKTIAELSLSPAGVVGSPDAPVTIIEFSDYQCPFCRRWFDDSKAKIFQKYVDTGKVRMIFKDFPLSFHPMAAPSSNAARCAGEQGKYWEYHDKLFIEQGKLNPTGTVQYTLDDLKKWGADLGLNTSTFNSCVDSGKFNSDVTANFTEGSTSGVSGTPSFFIGKSNGNAQLIVGAQPYSTFESAIESLLSG